MNNNKKIRLVYFSNEKWKDHDKALRLTQSFGLSNVYTLPKNMPIEDACKVISYLSEKVEQENNLEPACPKSLKLVSEELHYYGFTKNYDCWSGFISGTCYYLPRMIQLAKPLQRAYNHRNNAIDLFTVSGDFELFKQTMLYDRYFEWFTPGITEDEVKDIYNQIGINLDEMLTPRQYNYIPKEEYDDVYRIDVNNRYSNSTEEDTLTR